MRRIPPKSLIAAALALGGLAACNGASGFGLVLGAAMAVSFWGCQLLERHANRRGEPSDECTEDLEACCAEPESCCSEVACNYWYVCEDGAQVFDPDDCPEACDGYWAADCVGGELVDVCCPAGMACNFGMSLDVCDDGTCVNYPDECEVEEECDGYWASYCESGTVVDACCPAGMACNFGWGMEICEDGSCVQAPNTCEAEAP